MRELTNIEKQHIGAGDFGATLVACGLTAVVVGIWSYSAGSASNKNQYPAFTQDKCTTVYQPVESNITLDSPTTVWDREGHEYNNVMVLTQVTFQPFSMCG